MVKKKVKQLVCMAGKFPGGKEFNIEQDAKAAKYVYENWSKPILFSGFEIGQKIKTGLPLVNNDDVRNSPVKDVFRICLPMAKEDNEGRMSWDQTAVLVALKGYNPFYKIKPGKIIVKEDGSNTWKDTGTNHCYLIESMPVAEVRNLINSLMMHQPQ